MDTRKLYNLTITNEAEMVSKSRIGLLRKRTGVPVFLIYLKGVDRPISRYFSSYEGVVAEMERSHLPWDKDAWRSVLPFFFAEGREAYVSAVPLSERSENISVASLIGRDSGLKNRTGIHSLKSFADLADLVVIPQAASLLSLDSLFEFYRQADLNLSPLEHFFSIWDLPCGITDLSIPKNLSGLHVPDAAIYHPWLVMDRSFFPPSAMVAAHIQHVDESEGIQFIPANRKLNLPMRPVSAFTPLQTQQFNASRINVIQSFGPDDLRIWGGRTLAEPGDNASRFIASRRLLLALKETIEEIAAPFVMEPLTPNLPHIAEVQLLSVLGRHENLFDPDSREPYRVSVSKRVEQGEDILDIHFSYSIPYAVDEFNFSLGLTG